jgi:hypothetical protein
LKTTTPTILLVLAALLPGLPASAAPPTLTHLYPAGGKQGTTVTVALGGTFDRWPVGAWVSGKGVEAKAGKQKGQLTLTIAADATPGPRWLRVHDGQGASPMRRFVVGVLPEVMEKEPNDDASKPQPVTGDAVVNGRLEKAGDVDCYSVKLKKGQTLVASVLANRVLGSPMDGVVQVLSEKGFVLAQNNDHAGLDPQVTYTAPEEGTYVVRVFAFPAVPDASVRFAGGERFIYRLTLTTAGFADHAWPLAVRRGKEMKVGLTGWNLDKGVKADVVETEGGEGVAVAKGVAGDAFVRLEPHECVVRQVGKEPQKLTLPVTVSGRIDKQREKHVYEIAGRKGQRLEVFIESAQAGFSLDGVLRLFDKAGKQLARAQSAALHRDATLSFVLPREEQYRLEVSDAQADGGPRHLYRLRVLNGEPDFSLSVTADRFALMPGKTLDVAVTVTKKNGFAAELTLEAEGLPAGVRAEMVPAAKGASTLTLRLRADEKAASGAFRIVGKTKDGKVRAARVAAKEAEERVEWLWVNVAGK